MVFRLVPDSVFPINNWRAYRQAKRTKQSIWSP